VTCSVSYLRKSNHLLYFYHLCFACLILPNLCRKRQARTKKEVSEQRSARLSDLSSLKRASSSKQMGCTLLVRFHHTSKIQAARLSDGSSLKRESSREQPYRTLLVRSPKVQAPRLSDRERLSVQVPASNPFARFLINDDIDK